MSNSNHTRIFSLRFGKDAVTYAVHNITPSLGKWTEESSKRRPEHAECLIIANKVEDKASYILSLYEGRSNFNIRKISNFRKMGLIDDNFLRQYELDKGYLGFEPEDDNERVNLFDYLQNFAAFRDIVAEAGFDQSQKEVEGKPEADTVGPDGYSALVSGRHGALLVAALWSKGAKWVKIRSGRRITNKTLAKRMTDWAVGMSGDLPQNLVTWDDNGHGSWENNGNFYARTDCGRLIRKFLIGAVGLIMGRRIDFYDGSTDEVVVAALKSERFKTELAYYFEDEAVNYFIENVVPGVMIPANAEDCNEEDILAAWNAVTNSGFYLLGKKHQARTRMQNATRGLGPIGRSCLVLIHPTSYETLTELHFTPVVINEPYEKFRELLANRLEAAGIEGFREFLSYLSQLSFSYDSEEEK